VQANRVNKFFRFDLARGIFNLMKVYTPTNAHIAVEEKNSWGGEQNLLEYFSLAQI